MKTLKTLLITIVLLPAFAEETFRSKAEPTTVEALATKNDVTALKARIAALEAQLTLMRLEFQLQMQVCNTPELMAAKMAAQKAIADAEKVAKPEPAPK